MKGHENEHLRTNVIKSEELSDERLGLNVRRVISVCSCFTKDFTRAKAIIKIGPQCVHAPAVFRLVFNKF